ncbi:hypothetical protein [Cognatishimia activa]|uniref:hypothetical protein n=1 Tax=Cognatishimia activa TaxID=1715691 RepID=UPI0022301EA6|nr:hypothetical protein [Cognatishimia activa]UZD92116.1 hypothetical protein M0D42_05775 [Cognatishimia activa]
MTNEKDKSKGPTEPFNEAAYEMEVVFDSEIDDQLGDDTEEEKLRSNTAPKHDPKNQKNKGYTPTGSGPSLGASSSRSQGQEPVQPQTTEPQLSYEEWQHQLRNGDHTYEEEFNGLRVRTWMAEQPSQDNIRGGHIYEMIVTKGDYGSEERMAHFQDGAWEKTPEQTPEIQAVALATYEYDSAFLEAEIEKEIAEREQQRAADKDRNNGQSR